MAAVLAALLFCIIPAVKVVQAQLPDLGSATAAQLSSVEDITASFMPVPCNNSDRLAATVTLFKTMGAHPGDIRIDNLGVATNVVVSVPGTSGSAGSDRIVVGAHFDKSSAGCGAFDNWTGVTAIAHLYRTVKSLRPSKTILFVGFGEEEKGLIGSRAMVDRISDRQAHGYCAMINIDSLGNAMPVAIDNMSSPALVSTAARVAESLNVPFSHMSAPTAASDSVPFVDKGIPAITMGGMTMDWATILHTPSDTSDKVDAHSVYWGYRLGLSLLAALDRAPCSAFRAGAAPKRDDSSSR